MTLDLPLPLSRYFALSNGEPGVRVEDCFAAEATVHDEHQDHHGVPAITAWMARAREAYQHRTEPLQVEHLAGRHRVTSRVSGTFPGSPVVLTHSFVLAGDRICALEIG
ncbi:hypothetical protein D3C87_199200 [compost metagenome]|nr:polyketide cyclase [Stenotrophomonas sp.]HCV97551.1 polyketide cyclase [Stenotrophomonas sp.]